MAGEGNDDGDSAGAARAPDWSDGPVSLLAQGVSNQARVATRNWLAALVFALLVLIPQMPADVQGSVELPFGIGRVDESVYYPLAYLLLSLFVVALATSHGQHIRALMLAHRQFDAWDAAAQGSSNGTVTNRRDMFDMLVAPGLTRVAPLVQLLQQGGGLRSNEPMRGNRGSFAGRLFYLLLKIWALVVLFAVPGIALTAGYLRVMASANGWLLWSATTAGLVAVLVLATIAVFDAREVLKVARLAFGSRGDSRQ